MKQDSGKKQRRSVTQLKASYNQTLVDEFLMELFKAVVLEVKHFYEVNDFESRGKNKITAIIWQFRPIKVPIFGTISFFSSNEFFLHSYGELLIETPMAEFQWKIVEEFQIQHREFCRLKAIFSIFDLAGVKFTRTILRFWFHWKLVHKKEFSDWDIDWMEFENRRSSQPIALFGLFGDAGTENQERKTMIIVSSMKYLSTYRGVSIAFLGNADLSFFGK